MNTPKGGSSSRKVVRVDKNLLEVGNATLKINLHKMIDDTFSSVRQSQVR